MTWTREKALKIRTLIEKAAVSLNDTDALDGVMLFEKWSGDSKSYTVGQRLQYNGIL